MAETRIIVWAHLPSRRERLGRVLRAAGVTVLTATESNGSAPRAEAALADVSELPCGEALEAVQALLAVGPVLAIGGERDLGTLEAAMAAGAADIAVEPSDAELLGRARLLVRERRRAAVARRREGALVELAAASGESLETSTVLRAILDWLLRAVPGAEPAVILLPSRDAGAPPDGSPPREGTARVILPGPGSALSFARTEISERPDLLLALSGRLVRLDGRSDGRELADGRERLVQAGFSDAITIPLRDGGEVFGVLTVRARVPLEEDDVRLAQAAATLAARAVVNARAYDAAARERHRLERAYADRFRELLEASHRHRELSHQKNELLGMCAHDLRQPLNIVLGHARLLLAGARGELPPPARDAVGAIASQAGRMSELIEDILDLHAIETGRLELKVQLVDLGVLCREVCDALAVTADERRVSLLCRTAALGPSINGDPSKLREVIANLLGNAIKFSPAGATVEVSAEDLPGGGGRVAVRDSGPGIPRERLEAILSGGALPGAPAPDGARADEERPRGEAGRRARTDGSRGLGLSIVREIAALHGGSLSVQSEVGRGSLFLVDLPGATAAAQPGATASDAEARRPRPGGGRLPRVLVVEDDDDLRAVLRSLLEEGHEVIDASDGEAGVRMARERLPDAILMDLMLPRLDGFGALEDLKRDPRTAEIPVIFLSAHRDDLTRVRGLELGAADFILKPFSSPELLARLERVLRTTRKHAHLRALAQEDALTGLPNFRAFRSRLEEEVKRARRYRNPLAAVMIDLDNLKPINDRLGHAAGNRAIVALAEAIRAELRETDFAARYGGDEFVILLPQTTSADAGVLAERLRAAVRATVLDDGRLRMRASFGVAALPAGADAAGDALVRAADGALYQAKRTGRDRVCMAPELGTGQPAQAL